MTSLIQDFAAKTAVITAVNSADPHDITIYENDGVQAVNGGYFAIRNIEAGELDHPDFGATTAYYINNVLVHEECQ